MTGRPARARGGDLIAAVATGLVLTLLAACATGGGNPPEESSIPPRSQASDPATPPRDAAGKTLTVADNGSTVRLLPGEMAILQLTNPVTADPQVTGTAVRLDAIANIAESPTQQWQIHALRPGTARITASDGQGRTLVLSVDVQE